jgi:hypothetical protein
VQAGLANLYRQTFFNPNTQKQDKDYVINKIDDSLDKISRTVKHGNEYNLSSVYTRLYEKNPNAGLDQDYSKLFQDDPSLSQSVMAAFYDNAGLLEKDKKIDMLCKYMPTLGDALDALLDNAMSADSFSSDPFTVISVNENDKEHISEFNQRIKYLKKKYDLVQQLIKVAYNASKYGEQFVYIPRYNKAVADLMKNRVGINGNLITESAEFRAANSFSVNSDENYETVISVSESTIGTNGDARDTLVITESTPYGFAQVNLENALTLQLEFARQPLVESVVKDAEKYGKASKIIDAYENIKGSGKKKVKISKTVGNDEFAFGAPDGLVNTDVKQTIDERDITVPGCIFRTLDRSKVIPVYTDTNLCLGYYYFEYDTSYSDYLKHDKFTTNLGMFGANRTSLRWIEDEYKFEDALKKFAAKMSEKIDVAFINANIDIKDEIYAILKSADAFREKELDKMRVSFIPPGDMIHFYYDIDVKTHRGLSDLENSIFPATMYSSLYLTTWLGVITRGNDRRMYLVKQSSDTNISGVLMNVINQIKKGNMGVRELISSKNIFNILGRYQDMVIPTNMNGDPPIQFEIMQGQDIQVKTELFDIFEQMAINPTSVPYEYLQSRKNVDYAIRLSMANGKFLKKVYLRQQLLIERLIRPVFSRMYNGEYNGAPGDVEEEIAVRLPVPTFLNVVNMNTSIENVKNTVEFIVESEVNQSLEAEPEKLQALVKKNLYRAYLPTFVDYQMIDRIISTSKQELQSDFHTPQEEQ